VVMLSWWRGLQRQQGEEGACIMNNVAAPPCGFGFNQPCRRASGRVCAGLKGGVGLGQVWVRGGVMNTAARAHVPGLNNQPRGRELVRVGATRGWL
jgi:hypothetical protein